MFVSSHCGYIATPSPILRELSGLRLMQTMTRVFLVVRNLESHSTLVVLLCQELNMDIFGVLSSNLAQN